jgi:hypothetical protein
MKKLIPFLMILLCSAGLSAQVFSVRGGVNVATLRGDNVVATDNVVGWYFGPSVDLGLGLATIDVSLLYGRRGAKDGASGESTKLDYLDLPVLLKFNFGIVYVEAGPYASILLSATEGGTDIKELLKGADYGAMGIGGVALGDLAFELKYLLGMSDIIDDDTINIKNGSFSVGLRYCF